MGPAPWRGLSLCSGPALPEAPFAFLRQESSTVHLPFFLGGAGAAFLDLPYVFLWGGGNIPGLSVFIFIFFWGGGSQPGFGACNASGWFRRLAIVGGTNVMALMVRETALAAHGSVVMTQSGLFDHMAFWPFMVLVISVLLNFARIILFAASSSCL